MKLETVFGIIAVILLLAAVSAEAYIMYSLYINADKVECNLLWCVFTTEGRNVEITTNITQTCYMNGEKVPCKHQFNISSDGIKNIGSDKL
jgi:hypothetical protein